jgi:DNA-binding transcriptional LysR family regulator
MKPVHLNDVEIRHLQALQAVAAEGSFGRAADRLGFSQSGISQQIAALERVLGHKVFDRPGGSRRVELTPVGATLLTHAIAVLEQLHEAERDVEKLLAGGGRLVIGSFQSVSVKILPAVVGRILGESPELDIRCVEYNNLDEIMAPLHAGELDLAFAIGAQLDQFEGIEHRLLCTDPFFVISPAAVKVSPTISAGDVADLPLIGEQPGGSCQNALEADLRTLGIDPSYVFRSNDNSAIQSMVRSGMGHAIRPYLAIDPSDPGIVVRDMLPALPPRHIRIAWREGRTLLPAAQRFVEIATEVCATMSSASDAA